MSDWNPQVVEILSVEKHPFADNLDIATVLGDYPVICKLGEYQVGDIAGYLPIDTVVPDTEQFYFLCPKQDKVVKYSLGNVPEKYRLIKAKKIRGIYSQGMLVKVDLPVGTSLVEVLNLQKVQEDEEETSIKLKPGKTEKSPIGWSIPYYDICGLRQYSSCLLPDEELVITEKLHGSSASFCHDGQELWVKSRNLYKRKGGGDSWWEIAIKYNLEEKLVNYLNFVFFGEIYGVQKGFTYDTTSGIRIRFFDIFDVKSGRYLDYDIFLDITSKLGLDVVPELYRGKWLGKEIMYQYAEGMTTLAGKHIREGVVIKSVKERYEPKLNSRMILKLVGEGYNLKK